MLPHESTLAFHSYYEPNSAIFFNTYSESNQANEQSENQQCIHTQAYKNLASTHRIFAKK